MLVRYAEVDTDINHWKRIEDVEQVIIRANHVELLVGSGWTVLDTNQHEVVVLA